MGAAGRNEADGRLRVSARHPRRGRGITSVQGKPAQVDPSTFYGDPEQSEVEARVNIASAALEQAIGGAMLRNRTVIAGYDPFYQNFVPGAASADQQTVALTAYNNATDRTNVFNQTDVTYTAHTGAVRHTLLAGVEVGRQLTDNFRNTGFSTTRSRPSTRLSTIPRSRHR